MKPIGLRNFIFSTLNYLSQIDYFPTCIPNCDPHSLSQLGLLISFDSIICSTVAFPLLAILIMFLSHFTLIFLHSQREMLLFMACFWIIHMLIEMDFDHLSHSMEVIFKLGTSADAEFYPSLQISSQVTFISIVFSCLHCCHTSLKRLFSLVPTELLMLIK